jgi:transcriptional regulator with XRE-family HTH domain
MDLLDKESTSVDVGVRLRELRQERGMSMRALARASGLSTNALSMIERARTSPSVSTLYKIADALEVPITAFFRLEPPKQEVVFRKASEHTRISFPRGQWEGLGGEAFVGGLEAFLVTLESGATSGPFGMIHCGDEFVMCQSGQLEYQVEDQQYLLEPGDSLILAAQLRHRWRNPGKTVAKAIIIMTCADHGERPSEFHLTAGMKGDQIPDEENEAAKISIDSNGGSRKE